MTYKYTKKTTTKYFYYICITMNKILSFFLMLSVTVASCAQKVHTFSTEELQLKSGDNAVYGVLYRPDGVKKAPLVIISHGFGGTHLVYRLSGWP